jgi:exopolyphosphatase/guanosine-5'-triphosphate,3'-diphosphate pyrophosphatase
MVDHLVASGMTSAAGVVPAPEPVRRAVVDLGSNSVRLVVFEGDGRNPAAIFNEKAVLRLGRGLQASGRLNQEGVDAALTVMHRYHAIARALEAETFEVLATAAARDASNGPEFIAGLRARMPGVPITILSGEEEAALAADGLLCGIPEADGLLADIGGGSLELVRLERGRRGRGRTLGLGVLRLAERAGGDAARARAIAEADLAGERWIGECAGQDLYCVGGAWRALARIHIAQTGYPLAMVHHYTISREEARDLAGLVAAASRRQLERLPGIPRRRVDDLPFAAVVLRRLLRASGARRVVFSANGLREGWYMRQVASALRGADPLMAAAQDYARRFSRDLALPPALMGWTAPLFPGEGGEARRQREAACWMSDIGIRDHPEYRAEQAFLRIFRQPGTGLDHPTRAFLGLALALRYEAEPTAPFLRPATMLLSPEAAQRATVLGVALRLAYTLSAGTSRLLAGTRLVPGARLVLELPRGTGVFAGEGVTRRLEMLARAVGGEGATALVAG